MNTPQGPNFNYPPQPGTPQVSATEPLPIMTPTTTRRPSWAMTATAVILTAGLVGSGSAIATYIAARDATPAASAYTQSDRSSTSVSEPNPLAANQPINWQDVANTVSASVVSLQVRGQTSQGQGSGVIIDSDGHIVTNHHVVAAGINGQIRVVLADATVIDDATVVGTDPATDLAVVKVPTLPSSAKPITIANSDSVQVGQPVMAAGSPLGLKNTITTGIVSATDRPVTTRNQQQFDPASESFGNETTTVTNAIQTDAAINPGNSGGALVNTAGELIGINSSIASFQSANGQAGSIGLGFAIPSNEVKRVANELIETGQAEHPLLGVSAGDSVVAVNGQSRLAATIAEVNPGGAAATAGLQQGDAIVKVDDESVTSAESLTAQIRERAPYSKVKITVVRDGKEQEFTATLGTK